MSPLAIRVVLALALSMLVTGCPSPGGGGGGNDAPLAVDDVATTAEDTPATIDVLANDTDADDDVIVVSGFTEATNGTVSIDGNGAVSYAPDPEFTGTDTFTYTITDGGDEPATATVTVTVSAEGDLPIAVGDDYSIAEDGVLIVDIQGGVLSNDSDVDSTPTAVLDTDVTDGVLALAADGSFTYTPDADFSGTDSFGYHATDGANDSPTVMVTITVTPENDAPVADDDDYTVNEDGVLTVVAGAGVLDGDTDPDADSLIALLSTPPSNGSIALALDGSFVYTPAPNFAGADSFQYHARDAAVSSNLATVTITVTGANDAPIAAADSFDAIEDVALVVAAPGVLANDVDPEGDGITALAAPVATPANGSLAFATDGSFLYTPNTDFFGTDTFTYRATDGALDSTPTLVTIDVAPANDLPSFVAGPDVQIDEDDPTVTLVDWATGLTAGPANELGQSIRFELYPVDPSLFSAGPSVDSTGTLSVTPAPDAFGVTAVILVAIDDGGTAGNPGDDAQSMPQLFTINVQPINDLPSFTAATALILADEDSGAFVLPAFASNLFAGPGNEPQDLFFDVQVNNADPGLFFDDGDCSTPNCGQPSVDGLTGDLTFFPGEDAFGAAVLSVYICDDVDCLPTLVDIQVAPLNDPPTFLSGPDVAVLDSAGPQLVFWVQAVDFGPNEFGQSGFYTVTFDDPSDASLFETAPSIDPDGLLFFTPSAGTSGDAELTVTLTDDGIPAESSVPHDLVISVRPQSDPPTLISTSVAPFELLSAQAAFGMGQRLAPITLTFDDPELDCGGILVDATRNGSPFPPGGFSTMCFGNLVQIYVQQFSTDPEGDLYQFDLSNVCDQSTNCMDPVPSTVVVSLPFTYDGQQPTIVQSFDPFGDCAANQRSITRWSEPLDPASFADFRFEHAGTPVLPSLNTFGTLNAVGDTHIFVPAALLPAGPGYLVDYSGFRDPAGNPSLDAGFGFSVCGNTAGGGSSLDGLASIDFTDGGGTLATIPPSAITDGMFQAPSAVATGANVQVIIALDPNVVGGIFDPGSVSGTLSGGGSVVSFAYLDPEHVISDPVVLLPGQEWSIHAQIGTMMGLLNYEIAFLVLDPSDVSAPSIVARNGRRSLLTTPVIRPAEPLRIGFSEACDRTTLVPSSFAVTGPSGPVAVTVTSNAGDTAFNAPAVLVRAASGSFAPGSYTMLVSGVADFGDPANTIAPTPFSFEVTALGGTPSLVATAPNDAELEVSTHFFDSSLNSVFFAFDDDMSFSSIDASLTLTEQIDGTISSIQVPLLGLHATNEPAADTRVVQLSFVDSTGSVLLDGFTPDRGYTLGLGTTATNLDGTPIAAPIELSWSTDTNTAVNRVPALLRLEVDANIVPPGIFLQGQPFVSQLTVSGEVVDADFDPLTLTITGGDIASAPAPDQFSATLAVDPMLPNGATTLTIRIEDPATTGFTLPVSIYRPSTLNTPVIAPAMGGFTVSGTITGNDADFADAIEVGLVEVDSSSGSPNIVGILHQQMAQISRNASGDISWSTTITAPIPDTGFNQVRAIAGATFPFAPGGLRAFSPPSAPLMPNSPPSLVTITGTVIDGTLQAVTGATVSLAGSGYQTTSLFDGSFSLDVPVNQLGYLRATFPGSYGYQLPVRTRANMGALDLQVIDDLSPIQGLYDQIGGPIVDPGDGTVLLYPGNFFGSMHSSSNIIGLMNEGNGFIDLSSNPGEVPGELYMNVSPGTGLLSLVPSTCRATTFDAIYQELMPFPASSEAGVLTLVPIVCD